ncbi:hypothetical protein [Fibrobacter sp. UBA4297]|uniref:hypothetical protein n=1 Tax=Fibrobacter sp. UBA4297 TaxID=1946536 RepID=UPI0025C709BB|nr:hypothetical protein [Fibrobacter sp. UBA4297]
MSNTRSTLLALGLGAIQVLAASNVGLADCGGLFMLHQKDKHFAAKGCSVKDSFSIKNFVVHGSIQHLDIRSRYTENNWHLKSVSRQTIASAGFESNFKNYSLGLDVSTLPMVMPKATFHRDDSLFSAKTRFAFGSINLGTISWIPTKKTDLISTIPVDWESHFVYSELSAGSKIGSHYFNLSLNYIRTFPRNPDKEYYLRDSAGVLILNGEYGHTFSGSRLDAGYAYFDADMTVYGIYHEETSRKRFMYLPIEANVHMAYARWQKERLWTHLELMHISGKIFSNQERFYETLALNRALPGSVLKGLSFSFLQRTFRADAELDASAIVGGASYYWKMGKRYIFKPSIELDFFGAGGEVDIQKEIETVILTTHQVTNEKTLRKVSSIGSVLSLGFEFQKEGPLSLSLQYGISQIIPFYVDYKDYLADSDGDRSTPQKPSNGSSGSTAKSNQQVAKDKSGSLERSASALLFRNGFATHLGISVKF